MVKLGLSIFIFLFSFAGLNAAERVVEFGPAVIELTGIVVQEEHYGPPGFGANPESDAIDVVPILVLSKPITVQGRLSDPLNSETLANVEKIQLIMSVGEDPYCHEYVGNEVKVSGWLLTGNAKNHYTRVLMSVQTIETIAYC